MVTKVVTEATIDTVNCSITVNTAFYRCRFSDGGNFYLKRQNFSATYYSISKTPVVELLFEYPVNEPYLDQYYKILANDGVLIETVNENLVTSFPNGSVMTATADGKITIDNFEVFEGETNESDDLAISPRTFGKLVATFSDPQRLDNVIAALTLESGSIFDFEMSGLDGIYSGIGADIITKEVDEREGFIRKENNIDYYYLPLTGSGSGNSNLITLDDIFYNP